MINKICPVCGKASLHRVSCGIYDGLSVCQEHCRTCPYRDNSYSLSHCTYRREMLKNGLQRL